MVPDQGRPAGRAAIDPVTLEVIGNRLSVIADEMQSALVRSAFSPIIKEAADGSCALFTVAGETVAQAVSLPALLGALASGVQTILRHYPRETMQDGDIYIMNDPYDGGTHIPDLSLLTPVFWQGRLVALAGSIAHHQDFGGMTIGSLPTDATEIYQEGLILPPVKLMEAGEFNKQVLGIILKNVRLPTHTMADLRAQIAACRTGGERFQSLCAEHGAAVVLPAIDELMDRAEVLTRASIAEMPDGHYTFWDYLDNDGIIMDRKVKIQATLAIAGSDIAVDFTGTDPTLLGAANAAACHGACVTYYCVRCVTDPTLPNNSGCFRPIKLFVPEGTVVNPRHPAPLGSRTMTMGRMTDVIFGCLAQAAPARVRACSSGMHGLSFAGHRLLDGRPYVYNEMMAGGMGGRRTADGVDYVESDITNVMNTPTEVVETEFPLRVHCTRLRQDSGGAGQYRGGLGMEKVYEILEEGTEVTHRGDRHITRPWGLLGGLAGASFATFRRRVDGAEEKIPSRLRFRMQAGEKLQCLTAGGGGYGDPLLRPPDQVLADVLDGKVSLQAAGRDYGVVIDPTTLALNAEATVRQRQQLRASRGDVGETFDRGESEPA